MSYKQPPNLTQEEIQDFIKTAKIARICTHNKDGSIHAVPVWYTYTNDEFQIGTVIGGKRYWNMKRNQNVTLLIDVYEGAPKGLIVYGKARLETNNAKEIGVKIFSRYMPDDNAVKYADGLFELTDWVICIVSPYKFGSFDYSKDEAYAKATTF